MSDQVNRRDAFDQNVDPAPLPRRLLDEGVVVVLRVDRSDHVERTADTLCGGGLACLEVTFTLPDTAGIVRRLRRSYGENASIGAGTVTSAARAEAAIEAGAEFLVSPLFRAGVAQIASAAGVPYIAGALTPTEIDHAWTAGVAAVKVFPAGLLGPRYLAVVREPLPEPKLIPSGGITIAAAADYLAAGASAVSLGNALLGTALLGGSQAELAERIADLRTQLAAPAPAPNTEES